MPRNAMPGFRPRVQFEGKMFYFDSEARKWFDEGGKEVPPQLAFKLQGRFSDLR